MATLRTEIQQLLAERFNNATPGDFKAISDCYHIAQQIGIKIDEDYEDSKVGKQYAEIKVHSVHFNEVKKEMIPLQCPSLWHKWAQHDKEQHRHAKRDNTESVTAYNEKKIKKRWKSENNNWKSAQY